MMMKPTHVAALLLAGMPAIAELPMSVPAAVPQNTTAPLPSGVIQNAANMPVRPVEAEAPVAGQQAADTDSLSEAEKRIRIGIMMLGRLHDLLAHIKDEQSAEAAVAPVMRASAEFLSWAQGFSSLPPLDAETQRLYEKRYLPIIDALNSRIRIQGERLASAEFYGSQNLPAALVRLVISMQG